MLKINNISVEADKHLILDGLSLNVEEDEIHVIMGPNGAGKSTVCKAIMAHPDYKIKKGFIKFNGKTISSMSTDQISREGIFYLMQNPTEIPGVTNAELLRAVTHEVNENKSIFEFNKELNQICSELNIDKSYIHHEINMRMSGGEKKKNEFLQLYELKPKLILLDELDSGLDVDALKDLSTSLLKYKENNHASIIIITHHTNILEYITPDHVHILTNGKIIKSGDAQLAKKIEKEGFARAIDVDEV